MKKFKQPLLESLSDTLIVYMFLKKLTTPFKEWEAYKLGIIDEDGNKLKEPKTSKEKAAWTILDKFIWNIKKILQKFVGKSKLAAYLSIAYLLKDSVMLMISGNDLLLEKLLEINDELTYTRKKELYEGCKLLNEKIKENFIKYNINEDVINECLKYYNKEKELFDEVFNKFLN